MGWLVLKHFAMFDYQLGQLTFMSIMQLDLNIMCMYAHALCAMLSRECKSKMKVHFFQD